MLHRFLWLIPITAALSFFACTGSKNNKASENPDTQIKGEKHYQAISGNINRLCALHQGFFVLKRYLPKQDSVVSHTTEMGDSILIFSQQLGRPNRDGHWLLLLQFTSSLPDDILIYQFQKVEQLSRDTLQSKIYAWPEQVSLKELYESPQTCMEGIDLKAYSDTATVYTTYTYTKKKASHFEALSKPYPPFLQQNLSYQFRQDVLNYHPEGSYMSSRFYSDSTTIAVDQKEEDIISHYKRLPKEALQRYMKQINTERAQ